MVFQVAINPHLPDDVYVKRIVDGGYILDDKPRGLEKHISCSINLDFIKNSLRQMIPVKRTVAQKVNVPKRMMASSTKSLLIKNE